MPLFLITFFTIYSGIHVYAFFKAKAVLFLGAWGSVSLVIFFAVMVLAPFIIHFSEKAGLELIARLSAYIGYTWLGILFLFFSYSITLDIYRLLVRSGGAILQKDLSFMTLGLGYAFFLPLFFSLVTTTYGYFEAKNLRTERIVIRSPKISAETEKIRIVQISDVHIGLIVRRERLQNIVQKVRAEAPDIVVSTGDLVDGQTLFLDGLSDLLKGLEPRLGKFAITGNHEYHAGLPQAKDFIKRAGFILLQDEAAKAGDLIIAGVDDPAGKRYGQSQGISEKELLAGLSHDRFILLLKHRPLVDKDTEGLFDLQLSGHTHKGQIFPFSLITKFYYPVHAGFVALSHNAHLYVSRGAGTWGPPIRFLSPPEITVIDLVHDDSTSRALIH